MEGMFVVTLLPRQLIRDSFPILPKSIIVTIALRFRDDNSTRR